MARHPGEVLAAPGVPQSPAGVCRIREATELSGKTGSVGTPEAAHRARSIATAHEGSGSVRSPALVLVDWLGETMTDAVIREVTEETGITVEVTGLVGIDSNPRHVMAYDNGEARQEFSICFRARPVAGQPRTSDESSEVRWVERHQVDELNIHPSIRLRINHAFTRTEPYYT